MSTVYEGTDTRMGRTVAVKVQSVPPNLLPGQREALHQRMEREARSVGRISHPNVVQVYVAGEQDGLHYIVMEYLNGVTLQDRLDTGPLSPAETADVMDQVAAGLEAVHAQGVVHRDIKPSNIMILPGGVVKLTDFGVAYSADDPALTTQGMMVGSPSYMSPEQANGQAASSATDIWSLGVLLFHMLTARLPFPGENVPSVLYKIVHEEPELPASMSGGVAAVLRQALDKNADRRFLAPSELAKAFRAALPDLTVMTYRPAAAPTIPPAPTANVGRTGALLSAARGAFAPRVPRRTATNGSERAGSRWQIPAVIALIALGGLSVALFGRSRNPAPVLKTAERQTASASLPESRPSPSSVATNAPAPPGPTPRASPEQVARKNRVSILSVKVTPSVTPPSPSPKATPIVAANPVPAEVPKPAPVPKAKPTENGEIYGELLPPPPDKPTPKRPVFIPEATPRPTATPRPVVTPRPVATPAPQPAPARGTAKPTPPAPRPAAKPGAEAPIIVPDTEENEPPLAMPSEDNTPSPDAVAELRDLLGVWIAVTNERDIPEQMTFYAPRLTRFYQARNVSRDTVSAEKDRVFGRASRVRMNTSDLKITVAPGGLTAVMRFRKKYLIQGGPGARFGTVQQELRWRLLDDGWKIVSERDLSSE